MDDAAVLVELPERAIVALTIFGEARGEGPEGQIAVANVIRNRAACQRYGFGLSPREVCLKPLQFSCWNEADSNRSLLLDVAETLRQNRAPGPLLRQCLWIAGGLETDQFVDNTHGATHYLTHALLTSHPPAWAVNQKVLGVIGAHAFLRVA